MLIRRSFRYRLVPNKRQAMLLQQTLDRCCELYNAALDERRQAYRRARKSISFAQQSRQLPDIKKLRPEYAEINSQVLQEVLQRLDRAFQAFFRRVKAGQTPGFPRFKSRDRYDSFTFKQSGWKLEASRLKLSGIGALKVRWSRPLEGTIKTVTIRRDGDHWYACFSCEVEIPDPKPSDRMPVGIDLGLEAFATLSTGEQIENPRHLRKGEADLARKQQALSRKQRGSNRRKKAKAQVARAHRKIRNQRLDFHHKVARKLSNTYGDIYVENLRVRNMVRNHALAKSISDAGWAQFIAILTYKAAEAGGRVIAVNPSGTSQVCSGCGQIVEKDLSDRWHRCDCGVSLHRDHNAALNILRAGQARREQSRESMGL